MMLNATNHGLETGDPVYLDTAPYAGLFIVTKIDDNNFSTGQPYTTSGGSGFVPVSFGIEALGTYSSAFINTTYGGSIFFNGRDRETVLDNEYAGVLLRGTDETSGDTSSLRVRFDAINLSSNGEITFQDTNTPLRTLSQLAAGNSLQEAYEAGGTIATSYGDDLNLGGDANIWLTSTQNSIYAIKLETTGLNGGMRIYAGGLLDIKSTNAAADAIKISALSGGIDINAGTSGVDLDSSGPVTINSTDVITGIFLENTLGPLSLSAATGAATLQGGVAGAGWTMATTGSRVLRLETSGTGTLVVESGDFLYLDGVSVKIGTQASTTGNVDIGPVPGNVSIYGNGAIISATNLVTVNSGVGDVDVTAAEAIKLTAGSSSAAAIDINATAGGVNFASAIIYMGSLPTSDPTNTGQLWNNSGVVTVSAG